MIRFSNHVAGASGAEHSQLALVLLVASIHVFSRAVPSADQTGTHAQRPGCFSLLLACCLCSSAEKSLKYVHIHTESKKTCYMLVTEDEVQDSQDAIDEPSLAGLLRP